MSIFERNENVHPRNMIVLMAAVLAAPMNFQSDNCAVVERFYLEAGEAVDCCQSCALGKFRATTWITSIRQQWASEKTVDQELRLLQQGSGESGQHVAAIETKILSDISKRESITRPCGQCYSLNACLDMGGHVNTWHRTCSMLQL